ncbi:aminoglycoside phosphotransferase (APT) family kinase protein [Actinomadura catellatispora]|uniref:Aminoglycoside phosphotransferase (APT) family kinase protein n=1 Tax=Actinomadura livida TaxID=79909 RepID=A0A7W7IJB6_9ACTN|nr:aminoglycoside phosphotransferase (APT) family kinase protein [Actinomadura catellatispora]
MTHTQAPCLPTGGPPARAALRWVEECLGKGAEVRTVRPLPGGMAHTNHALRVESGSGSTHELVLRRWTSREPAPGHRRYSATAFSPEREIAALALLAGCEIPTPALVAADPAGAYCDVPALLITLLAGHPPHPSTDDLPEYLIQLAAALLPLHTLNGASTMPPYVPHNRLDVRRPPRHALRPALWERAHDVAARPAPEAPARFIHRDYHADNTLWSYGRLTGVVDWSDASSGPIAVDIARMRRGLALRYGPPVADRFLTTFDQVSGGYPHDPYWDVRVLLDLLPEDETGVMDEAHVPLYENYLARILAQC